MTRSAASCWGGAVRLTRFIDHRILVRVLADFISPATHRHPDPPAHSHSMVPGGLVVTSSTTRLTSRHLVGDPGRDAREHLVGHAGPVGGHRVLAGHRPQHDRVPVGAPVALHARPNARRPSSTTGHCQISRSRPAAVSSSRAIASASRRMSSRSRGHLADDADAEARARGTAGARRSPRQAELLADRAHLVLEQRPQRLDQLELQVVGQPADVVVALDVRGAGRRRRTRRRPGTACPAPGTRRSSPCAPASATISRAACSNTRMNSRPMILRFSSGSLTPGQRVEEPPAASTTLPVARRWRRRSPARPARPRPRAAARGRRTRR